MKRLSDDDLIPEPKKKKRFGSKQKGGAFEILVCKQLSLWQSNGERDDLFWRSSLSGGRATVQFKAGKANKSQTGDISSIDPLGSWLTADFLFECKSLKTLNLSAGVVTNKGLLYIYWEKLKADAKKIAKLPVLIAKENRGKILLVTNFDGETRLHLDVQKALALLPQWGARLYLFQTVLNTPWKH